MTFLTAMLGELFYKYCELLNSSRYLASYVPKQHCLYLHNLNLDVFCQGCSFFVIYKRKTFKFIQLARSSIIEL